ncbi:MAG: DUF4388 domain-containing protein [Cyanobacteriota bacterium]
MGNLDMKITGYLSEFSLGELFRFLQEGQKSGCLSIQPLGEPVQLKEEVENFYIFLQHGKIVAAANRLDHQGLRTLIGHRGWLRAATVEHLLRLSANKEPLGLYLKIQGALTTEQLKLLFKQQVLTPIPKLFTLEEGYFTFDDGYPPPYAEMTGLVASPQQVALSGLRLVNSWSNLIEKLPLPTSTLMSTIRGNPPYQLTNLEWQVWEYANGTTTISDIAAVLRQPLLEIQKVGFCLITVGIVEEVFTINERYSEPVPVPVAESAEGSQLSQSFLNSLLSFLQSKVRT